MAASEALAAPGEPRLKGAPMTTPGSSAFRLASVLIVTAVCVLASACTSTSCKHGSWAETDDWQCHDMNDERGPQRDQPFEWP